MVTIKLELRGRIYYFKAENKSDAEVLIFALRDVYGEVGEVEEEP